MATWTNSGKPVVACICGGVRVLPVEKCGDPPVGMESFCDQCRRIWTLVSYSADRERWNWTAEDPPATDIKAANALAKTLMGIDAALSDLAFTNGPTRGMA